MSVNGQDPRANVYLLDGTLLNDFTNGPAGSAAGTALGMDTVQEFRVEANTYSAEFGRNVGGQINAITKSGTNRLAGNVLRVPPQRRARCAQLLRRRRQAGLHAQPVRRRRWAGRFGATGSSFRRLRSAAREPRPHDRDDRAGRQRAAGPAADWHRSPIDPRGAAVPRRVSASPTARTSAADWPGTRFRSISGWISTSSRRGSTRCWPGGAQVFVPLHDRRHRSAAAHRLPAVSRAPSFRAISS